MSYKPWRGPYELDFVQDCGADPTGATDCGAAMAVAFAKLSTLAANLLLPAAQPKTFTLVVPPGIYEFNDPATVGQLWDFNNKANIVCIRGLGAASIFRINIGNNPWIAFANMLGFEMHDMTFLGETAINLDDVDVLINLNAVYYGLFSGCQWQNLLCERAAVLTQSDTKFYNCIWANSASRGAANGLVWGLSSAALEFEQCSMIDLTPFNGVTFPFSKQTFNTNWIRQTGPARLFRMEGCFVDEGCQTNIYLDGGAGRIRYAKLKGNTINGAVHVGALEMIHCEKVDHLDVDGITMATLLGVPVANILDSTRVDLAHVTIPVGSPTAVHVQADAATHLVRITDSPTITPTKVVATLTIAGTQVLFDGVQITGSTPVLTQLFGVTAGITAGQLTKVSGDGTVAPLAAGDRVSACLGSSYDGTGAGPLARVSRPGQPVLAISDGTGVINPGDFLVPSAVSPGRVAVSVGVLGTPTLGKAASAAAAVADAVLHFYFIPQDI